MSRYKLALSFAIVAAAGIVAGLLIAPQKGKKLRKKIRKKTTGMVDGTLRQFSSEKNKAALPL